MDTPPAAKIRSLFGVSTVSGEGHIGMQPMMMSAQITTRIAME